MTDHQNRTRRRIRRTYVPLLNLRRIAAGPCHDLRCTHSHEVNEHVRAFRKVTDPLSVSLLIAALLVVNRSPRAATMIVAVAAFLSVLTIFTLTYKPWFDHWLNGDLAQKRKELRAQLSASPPSRTT